MRDHDARIPVVGAGIACNGVAQPTDTLDSILLIRTARVIDDRFLSSSDLCSPISVI